MVDTLPEIVTRHVKTVLIASAMFVFVLLSAIENLFFDHMPTQNQCKFTSNSYNISIPNINLNVFLLEKYLNLRDTNKCKCTVLYKWDNLLLYTSILIIKMFPFRGSSTAQQCKYNTTFLQYLKSHSKPE